AHARPALMPYQIRQNGQNDPSRKENKAITSEASTADVAITKRTERNGSCHSRRRRKAAAASTAIDNEPAKPITETGTPASAPNRPAVTAHPASAIAWHAAVSSTSPVR